MATDNDQFWRNVGPTLKKFGLMLYTKGMDAEGVFIYKFLRQKYQDSIHTLVLQAAEDGDNFSIRSLVCLGDDINIGDIIQRSSPIHLAAWQGHADTVRLLAQLGGYVDGRDLLDGTPMHMAADNGHIEVVRVLNELGSDVNGRNKYGQTPMMLAVHRGHGEAIGVLKELGADVNIRDDCETTPMHIAAENGDC